MSATATKNPRFETLRAWLGGKGDASKSAGTLPEGDDGGKPATQGERSAENAADVKKLVPGVGIEEGKDNPMDGKTDKPVPDSGLMQTSTGKMPEIEKAVKVVTEENEKVSSFDLTTRGGVDAGIAALEKQAAALGLLATAAAGAQVTNLEPKPQATPAPAAPQAAKSASEQTPPAAPTGTPLQHALIASYAKFGSDRAEVVGQFLRGQFEMINRLTKAAEDGTMDAMMGGGAPPAAAPDAAPPATPAAAPAGPEGAPGADAGGGAGGTPSPDELASAMAEMNVSPDVAMQAAQKLQDMVAGPQGEAAAPEDKAAAAKEAAAMVKLAADTKAHMQAGKFRLKPAADGSPERARRDSARKYIEEMLRFAGN